MFGLGNKSSVTLVVILVLVIAVVFSAASIVDKNKSGEFTVKQAAISGKMTVIFDEGVFGQWWGAMNRYPNSDTYYFSADLDQGGKGDESIPVTFKNGSLGDVSGSVRMTYTRSEPSMIETHRRFRGHSGVINDLVRTEVRKLINMTASLMSPEAAMTQKGMFMQMFVDQVQNGQYQTVAVNEMFTDPISKEISYRDVVKVKNYDKDHKEFAGKPMRLENPFAKWNVTISQEAIQKIKADPKTLEMIAKRRDAEMSVMVAKAAVEKARQDEQKVIAEGKKDVAAKKYSALQEKETATVKADQLKEVAIIDAKRVVEVNEQRLIAAELDKRTATEEKLAEIERKTGEAKGRELLMLSDGALDKRLAAITQWNKDWAAAHAVRPVPNSVVAFGGGGGNASGGNDSLQVQELVLLKMIELADKIGDVDMTPNRSAK